MTIKIERLKEILKGSYYDQFMEWMEGQTVSEEGIYEDDFIRWINKLPIID